MKKDIKIGDKVKWLCQSYSTNDVFIAEGVVLKIGKSTIGASKKGISLQIKPSGKYCEVFPNRETTTISLNSVKD